MPSAVYKYICVKQVFSIIIYGEIFQTPKNDISTTQTATGQTLTKGFPNAAVVPTANDASSTLGGFVGPWAGKPRHIVVGA